VVAFDGPAHGDSPGKETNILKNGAAVRAAIEYFGGVRAIIAHSFGGASSVYGLGKLSPALTVEKLVLVAVPESIEKIISDAVEMLNLPPLAGKKFLQKVEQKIGYPTGNLNLSKADSHSICEEALLVYDKQDNVIELREGKRIYEMWSNASMLITEGHGHSRILKNPEVIDRVADFIAS